MRFLNYEVVLPNNSNNYVDGETLQPDLEKNHEETLKPKASRWRSKKESEHEQQTFKNNNACLGLVGEKMECLFVLPFTEFQPEKVEMSYEIWTDDVRVAHTLAECDQAQQVLKAFRDRIKSSCSAESKSKEQQERLSTIKQQFFPDEFDASPKKVWSRKVNAFGRKADWTIFAVVPHLYMNFTFTYDGKIEYEELKIKKSEKSVRFNAAAKLNKSSSGSRLKIFIDVDTPTVLAYPSALDSCIYLQHTLFGFYDSIVDYTLGEDQTAINYIQASKKLLEQSDEEPFQMDCRIDINNLDGIVPVPSIGVGPLADCEKICVEINRDNTTFKCQVCVDPINIKFSHDNFIKLDCISIRLQGLNNLGIEYSWLMEFLVGKLKFDLCVNNIQVVVSYLDAIMMFFKRPEFQFKNRLAKENLLPIYQNKAAIGKFFEKKVTWCRWRFYVLSEGMRIFSTAFW